MNYYFHAIAASRHAVQILHQAREKGGEIHSCYRRTINIRFPGDQLVCLHGGHRLVAPFGIALGRGFESRAFERSVPGARVVASDHLLRFPHTTVDIGLERAAVWEPRALPAPLGCETAARSAEVLTAVLLQHDNPDGLAGLADGGDATPLLRRARPSAERLMEAIPAREPADVLGGVEPLLGLGPGLTPSGDDFLAGFLGMVRLAVPAAEALLRAAGPSILELAETRTTLLSRAFLTYALEGVLAPPVDALAAALLGTAQRTAVSRAARAACGLGHTSGMDTVTGMLFALRALAKASW